MTDESRIQYKFMIPAGLKAALEESAKLSYRSLSAEIILRLTESVRDRKDVSDDPLENETRHLEAEIAMAESQRMEADMRMHQIMSRLEDLKEKRAAKSANTPVDQ